MPLAKTGATLLAVERGPQLAEIARRKLSGFARADLVVADFDQWQGSPASFDVVVAATAFHWLNPTTRVSRCAALLRPGGSLAIVQTRWGVAHGDDAFFAASQICYARWDPSHDPMVRQTRPENVRQCTDLANVEFADVVQKRYVCARAYSAAEYCELLGTFSDVLALEDKCRAGLLTCISSLIDSRFDGRIVRHDLYDLCIARRAG